MARRDPDGAVFIVGRAKDVIIRSGFNVYPEEVEAVLTSHPDVTLAAWAAERLAPYKRPARIVMSDSLPAAATGKILKHRLRERAAALDTTS